MDSRTQITHLINQYGFTIDTGDLLGFAQLFENAEWTVEGTEPRVGTQQVLDALSTVRIYEDGTPRTKHIVSNLDLEIDEVNNSAKSQCYVTVFQQTNDFPLQAIFCGHYFDRFQRVEGVWQFSQRIIRYMMVGDLSAHLNEPESVVGGA
ncbi:MAG: hypothetical protein CMK43_08930 [Porticoccaceae bacterium]|nr:hypothetical protein [Porticoccaceae bacterium]|tara:strand:+ start:677 stop:1126 length:450 start_codon:yes stop_codon:yes gene_type:complete